MTSTGGPQDVTRLDVRVMDGAAKLPERMVVQPNGLVYDDGACQVWRGDARRLPLPDASVDLVVTSPPYNARVRYAGYTDWLPWDAYWNELITASVAEMFRVLRPGGRLALNFANVLRQNVPADQTSPAEWDGRGHWRWTPPGAHGEEWAALVDEHVWPMLRAAGFLPRERICWVKGDGPDEVTTTSTAWGSWMSASNPVLRATSEPVFVASKGSHARDGGTSDVTAEEFKAWSRNTWFIPVRGLLADAHPAQFPIELPRRLIKLYSYVGDVVLDPFCGVATTLRAAKDCGRRGVGVDVSERYCALAANRCRQGLLFASEATAEVVA